MSYGKNTNFFNIPYMGVGEIMTEENNTQQMNIIDSLLYINSFMAVNDFFIEQGNYTYEKNGDNYYDFKISAKDKTFLNKLKIENCSLAGVLNHRLFYSMQDIEFSLLINNVHYLYVQEIPGAEGTGLNESPLNFQVVNYTQEQTLQNNMLPLCIISIDTQDHVVINTEFEGKQQAKNINAHLYQNTNPHGGILNQEKLNVNGNPVYGNEYISFVSSNLNYEYSFPQNKEIIFATAYAEDLSVTNIAWEIDNVNKKIIFKTSGNSGVNINVKLDIKQEELL